MIFEIKKAIESLRRPGIRSNIFRLARSGIHYYLPGNLQVPSPLTVYWSINSVCNLHCKMCDVGMSNESGTFYKNLRIDKKLHEIDINVFRKVVDELAPQKPFMAINSTEPLMYKPLGEAIEYCTAKGLDAAVTTGGYTLSRRAEELAEAGLLRLNVSIDGPPSVHNQIRGRPDSFEKAAAGISDFFDASMRRGRKPQIVLACTITNLNYTELKSMYEAVRHLPFDQISFQYMWFIDPATAMEHNNKWGEKFPVTASCFSEYMDPRTIDVKRLAREIRELPKDPRLHFAPAFDEHQLETYFHKPQEFVNSAGRCLASWFFFQVLADGNVIVYSRCHNVSLGNINEQTISEIWNGEKMKDWRNFIREAEKMPMCRRCDLVF